MQSDRAESEGVDEADDHAVRDGGIAEAICSAICTTAPNASSTFQQADAFPAQPCGDSKNALVEAEPLLRSFAGQFLKDFLNLHGRSWNAILAISLSTFRTLGLFLEVDSMDDAAPIREDEAYEPKTWPEILR
eukprot:s2567_g5.t1